MSLFNEAFQIVSLTLPLLLSGLCLILVLKIDAFKVLDKPLDHEISINNKRLLGNGKTYRGVFVHTVVAISVSVGLHLLSLHSLSDFIHPIFRKSPIFIGLIYSTLYTLGEVINSVIKRRLDIPAGTVTTSKYRGVQKFFDLADGIILAALGLTILTPATLIQTSLAAILGITLHCHTDILMRNLRLKHKS